MGPNFRELTVEDLLGRPLNRYERKHAPEKLYLTGPLKVPFEAPRISVVGTRSPSDEGVTFTRELVKRLVEKGIIVVSGLAKGIDTEAHTTAIESGGQTVAVLGTPLDRFYPPENRKLQQLIMEKHLAVSQFPFGHNTHRSDFVKRNRTMALISDATIIVEAEDGGGTLSQGWEAIRLKRPLFLAPFLLERRDLEWPDRMLDYGAEVLNLENIEEICETLPLYPTPKYEDLLAFLK